MKDTTSINVIKISSKTDTVSIQVDDKFLNHLKPEKTVDTVQIISIVLPVIAALVTLGLTKWFDYIFENKKNKNEIIKENRVHKIKILKELNILKTSLYKTNFTDPELEDFYEWTADRMIGVNPFHDLEINSNILFNKDIINIANKLYYTADEINRNFDWKNKTHPMENISLGGKILEGLDEIIEKISQNIKNE